MLEGAPAPRVAVTSSLSDLERSTAERRILLSAEKIVGVADSDPSVLKHLSSVFDPMLLEAFDDTDLAFIMSGLGGRTGGDVSKIITAVAAARSVPVIALVTMPFSAESTHRRSIASESLRGLLSTTALCVVFDNDELSSLAPNAPLSRAFRLMSGMMHRPIMDACSALSPADVPLLKQVFEEANLSRFGLGLARGDERVERVVNEALESPWYDGPFEEATAVFAVYSAVDPWDKEMARLAELVEARAPAARIAWGSYADRSLGERIRLSLIVSWKA